NVTPSSASSPRTCLATAPWVTLFERLPKSLALTGEGRSYVADVRRAFELLSNATANLKPQTVKLVVSTTPTFASRWLIPRLPDF
ncbi:hypothetical protein AB9F45_37315, partial [Rhizobium leguminosarum]